MRSRAVLISPKAGVLDEYSLNSEVVSRHPEHEAGVYRLAVVVHPVVVESAVAPLAIVQAI